MILRELLTSGKNIVFTEAKVNVSGEKVLRSMQLQIIGNVIDIAAKAVS